MDKIKIKKEKIKKNKKNTYENKNEKDRIVIIEIKTTNIVFPVT